MKRLIIILGMAGFLCEWSMAQSGNLGLHAAYWKTDDLDALLSDDGIGGGVKIQFDLAKHIGLDLRGSSVIFEESSGPDSVELEVMPAEAGLVFNLVSDGNVLPYIGGGAGYYFMEATLASGPYRISVDIDDEFGFYAVGGVGLMFGKTFGLFIEGKHTWVDVGDVDGSSPDVSLDGFGANAGLLVAW